MSPVAFWHCAWFGWETRLTTTTSSHVFWAVFRWCVSVCCDYVVSQWRKCWTAFGKFHNLVEYFYLFIIFFLFCFEEVKIYIKIIKACVCWRLIWNGFIRKRVKEQDLQQIGLNIVLSTIFIFDMDWIWYDGNINDWRYFC